MLTPERLLALLDRCRREAFTECTLAEEIEDALRDAVALLNQHAQATWTCKAQKTADPPQDCNWPNCGCDPYADKVIAALEEQAPGLFQIHKEALARSGEVKRRHG